MWIPCISPAFLSMSNWLVWRAQLLVCNCGVKHVLLGRCNKKQNKKHIILLPFSPVLWDQFFPIPWMTCKANPTVFLVLW